MLSQFVSHLLNQGYGIFVVSCIFVLFVCNRLFLLSNQFGYSLLNVSLILLINSLFIVVILLMLLRMLLHHHFWRLVTINRKS